MVAWPGTLPQDQFLPVTFQRQNARVATQMDAGPAKVRRRFTSVAKNFNCQLFLTGAELAIFDNFWSVTLQEGALEFDWSSPVDDTTVSMRFRPQADPPQYQALVGAVDPNKRQWQVQLELEIMP